MRKVLILWVLTFIAALGAASPCQARTILDGLGRTVDVPDPVERVICSGPGCLRLLTYLQAQDMVVAVDDIETRRSQFDARPYALANPRFRTLPEFGEFRGHDNPELILTLDPQPQVILKVHFSGGLDPDELQAKTGIPVVALVYGDLGRNQDQFFQALTLMGAVVGRQARAAEVIAFFRQEIADLEARTRDIPEAERPSVFLGGVAFRGPHGFQSTEPAYPPFAFVHANAPAMQGVAGKELKHSDVAKEKIVEWNPGYLFLDLSTLQMGDQAGGLFELRTDPAYQTLTAVRQGRVYGLLPYNWYSQNFGSILADAWFIGKLLYPGRFADVSAESKADEIYGFLVNRPVFQDMNALFNGYAFRAVPVQ